MLPPDHPKQLGLMGADTVIWDEMRMLTNQQLATCLLRPRCATGPNSKPKVLLLVGDHGQLPPPCKHSMDVFLDAHICSTCHIMFSPTWQQANKHILTHV